MSNIVKINATEIRNNWFGILSWILSSKKEILISKNKKTVARLIPESPSIFAPLKTAKETFGILKRKEGFPYENKRVIEKEKSLNIDPWKAR